MWDFSSGNEISAPDIFDQINKIKKEIEGVTILGGEPLDQYEETYKLVQICAENKLSVILFTGYELCEINQKGFSEIKNFVDILITGRYKENKRTLHHQWIGSTNQEIHFLSDRYSDYKIKNGNYQEITIEDDGSLTVFGFPI